MKRQIHKKKLVLFGMAVLSALSLLWYVPLQTYAAAGSGDELIPSGGTIPQERLQPRLVDQADLLTDTQEDSLQKELDDISNKLDFDVAIVTVDSTGSRTPQAFADDYYDYNGFGMGGNADGVLLLVSMAERDWHISTAGFGITAFTDAGLDYMSDIFVPYMRDGDYMKAFETYADLCDQFVTQAKNGRAYDNGNMPKAPFNLAKYGGIALIGGIVIALLIVETMRRSLKSVRPQRSAGNYIKNGSMNITDSEDRFLYANVSKRARPKSSSGSSAHRSSSGRSHGGRGGKF